jgi:hypothetical protein
MTNVAGGVTAAQSEAKYRYALLAHPHTTMMVHDAECTRTQHGALLAPSGIQN